VELTGASLLDVTPTIIRLFGLARGKDMDGRSWLEAMDAEGEPDDIASWDDVPGEAGLHPPCLRQSPNDSLAVLRHLISLGYLEAPHADDRQAIETCLDTNQYNLGRALLDAGLADEAKTMLEPLVQKHPHDTGYADALAEADRLARPFTSSIAM
jgi:hypothetical protein